MNLATLIPRHARHRSDDLAVIFEATRLTWRELDTRVRRTGHALGALGVRAGDRVATLLPNSLELLELYWACAAVGAVAVPLSPLLQSAGVRSLLADARPRVIITCQRLLPTLLEARDGDVAWEHGLVIDGEPTAGLTSYRALVDGAATAPLPDTGFGGDELYDICYSSGTTGLPKGITHSHEVRGHYASHLAAAFRFQRDSVSLHSGSIVFNGAFVTMMPSFYLGGTFVITPTFTPAGFLDVVERERVTHTTLVPSQITAILASPAFSPERLGSVQMLLSLGAPLPLAVKEKLCKLLPRKCYELYGLTEGFMTILDRDDFAVRPGSVGVPPPFCEMRICDDQGVDLPVGVVGEIVGRGPMLTEGYYNRPEATRIAIRDGWLYTGDLGYVDERGFLHLVDRKKDMIVSGGVNVYPTDIEEILHTHPAVLEAAVFGVEDARWGEVPVAAVVLGASASVTAAELLSYTNERVGARYQRLVDVYIVEALPRNVAGKTLKRELRAQFGQRRGDGG